MILVLAAPQVSAQSEDFAFDLDANVGLESLEEPNANAQLEANTYLTLSLALLIKAWNVQALIQGPLRFDLNGFSIREKDWDETEEILRAFRCVRVDYMTLNGVESEQREYGSCDSWTPNEAVGDVAQSRENFLYLSTRLQPIYDYSLGYGTLVDGYSATLEEDHYREGISAEANVNRHFVINLALSDIVNPTAALGRVAFRPVQSTETGYESSWGGGAADTDLFVELGVTTANDIRPPVNLNLETSTTETGDPLWANGFDARIRYSTENRWTMDDYRVLRFEYGVELNKIYGYGQALHNHLRFYYDVGAVDLYVDGEYRLILGQYIPSYFNQHYRVQRTQYLLSEDQRHDVGTDQLSMTKLDFLGSLPDTTEHAYAATMRVRFWSAADEGGGWYRAADWWVFAEQIPGRDLSGRAGTGLALYNLFDKVSVNGQFVQQGWDDLDGLFSLSNSVLEIGARYLFTESLYLDLFFDQTWFLVDDGGFDTANDIGVNLGYLPDF